MSFCPVIGSHITLEPVFGIDLSLVFNVTNWSVVSTEVIRPLCCIRLQSRLQSPGSVTPPVLKNWMLENFMQRSMTGTSIHFVAAPWRLHELFAQDNKSPFCFPHSCPEVIDTILSSDIRPENTFTLATLPRPWIQVLVTISAFKSTKFPTRLVGQPLSSNFTSKTFWPLTTVESWFLSQLIAIQVWNHVICKGSLGTAVSPLKRLVESTWKGR